MYVYMFEILHIRVSFYYHKILVIIAFAKIKTNQHKKQSFHKNAIDTIPWPQKLSSCSTQLRMEFILLIYFKMPSFGI